MAYQDKEKQKEYSSKYYQENKEKKCQYFKEYYKQNRDIINERNKKYNAMRKNKDEDFKIKKTITSKQYRMNHKEKCKAHKKKYRSTNRGIVSYYLEHENIKYKTSLYLNDLIQNDKDLFDLIVLIKTIKRDLRNIKKELNNE